MVIILEAHAPAHLEAHAPAHLEAHAPAHLEACALALPAACAPGSGDSTDIRPLFRRFGSGRDIGATARTIDAHMITTTTIIDTMSASPQSGIKTGRHIYFVPVSFFLLIVHNVA